jgi:hypothetical protein
MNTRTRELKRRLRDLLQGEDLLAGLAIIHDLPPKKVVNPLISFLYSSNPLLRWHSVTAMGRVVARMADEKMESARVVMRRLMWSLNDESGGIGWGAPEAMGEIMTQSPALAGEYAHILISYADPMGNYLEHVPLQRGIAWGIGRLAHKNPPLVRAAMEPLICYMRSPDVQLRGLAAWAASALVDPTAHSELKRMLEDNSVITIYLGQRLIEIRIADLIHRKETSLQKLL